MSRTSKTLIISTLLFLMTWQADADCVVDTPLGSARGFSLTTLNGREICSYTGLPYAQPPVGDLRFRNPQPVEPWSGEFDATQDGKHCLQGVLTFYIGDEDCLYLNVFTTQTGEPTGELLPVLVFIHGGSFVFGNGNYRNYGPLLLLDKDVIVITINYRLGILGFLSTGDDASPGNYGLKDQTESLRWIQNNIESFGGDPSRVTIMGESAGAMSVHYQILSPLSTDLFHRGIADSGSALLPMMIRADDPLPYTQENAAKIGCVSDDTEELMNCLRSVDGPTLMSINQLNMVDLMWRPVVEKQTENNPEPFLTDVPIAVIKSGNFNRVPFLLGTNAQEGSMFLLSSIGTQASLDKTNANLDEMAFTDLFLDESMDPSLVPEAWEQLKNFYFGSDHTITPDNVGKLIDLTTDRYMQHSVQKSAELHIAQGHDTVYLYSFAYRGKYSLLANARYGDQRYDLGVIHVDELEYVLSHGETANKWDEGHPDLEVVDAMVTLWTNFATYGNPTPTAEEAPQGVQWPPAVANNEIQYYEFGHAEPPAEPVQGILPLRISIVADKFKDRIDMWNSLPLIENE